MTFADPRLCYLLDGILFLYAIIVTAMFFKEKLSQHSSSNTQNLQAQQDDGTYNVVDRSRLNKPYEELKRRDVEKGERSKGGKDSVYSGIQQDKLNEPYSGLNIKSDNRKGKGNDTVYQGLRSGTRDTYDALHMHNLPPR